MTSEVSAANELEERGRVRRPEMALKNIHQYLWPGGSDAVHHIDGRQQAAAEAFTEKVLEIEAERAAEAQQET